ARRSQIQRGGRPPRNRRAAPFPNRREIARTGARCPRAVVPPPTLSAVLRGPPYPGAPSERCRAASSPTAEIPRGTPDIDAPPSGDLAIARPTRESGGRRGRAPTRAAE